VKNEAVKRACTALMTCSEVQSGDNRTVSNTTPSVTTPVYACGFLGRAIEAGTELERGRATV
jgi:hypothetical protein